VFRVADTGLHVLFGPNNSGKSRLLKLLRDAPASIEVGWPDVVSLGGSLLNEAYIHARAYAFPPFVFDVRRRDMTLTISPQTQSRLNELRHQMGNRVQGLLVEINGVLPLLQKRIKTPRESIYIRAHRYLVTTAPIENRDGDANDPAEMARVLSRLYNHRDATRRETLERIERAFNSISGVSFALRQSDQWTVHILEQQDPRTERPLDQCGDGLRDLLGLILLVEQYPRHGVFVDEPGVRLHPRAQRALLTYLSDAATARPVWLATHDGVFIGSPDLTSRYAVSRDGGVTTARRVTSPQETRHAFSELGWNPRDALLCDTILFCEGPSDKAVFSQMLEEPGHQSFQGVEVVQLGGDRVWGRDTARLKTTVEAVRAVAAHARSVALLDRGGHSEGECVRIARLLKESNVDVFWLAQGELEDFWVGDPEFCARLCRFVADAAALKLPEGFQSMIDAEFAIPSEKGSTRLERLFERLALAFSKREVAEAAIKLILRGEGEAAKARLIEDLVRALQR